MSSISSNWETTCAISETIAAIASEDIAFNEVTLCSDGSSVLGKYEGERK